MNVDTAETITHISLCAGYGGIDLGLKRCLPTLRTVLVSEIEAYAVANLVAKMEAGELDPCPIWTDLKTLPLDSIPENISILSGGFPCQPFSAAGKREGDEDPRHLFPYIKNAIRTIQPEWVFLENVEGIISAKLKGDGWEDPAGTPVLLHVIRELERVGYRATAGIFSAAEVGATHQRKRVFILARRLADTGGIPSAYQRSRTVNSGGSGETKEIFFEPANEQERGDRQARQRKNASSDPSKCGNGSADVAHSGGAGLEGMLCDAETEGRKNEGRPSPRCGEYSGKWPARPGEPQQEWEEPRVISQLGGTTDGPSGGLDATANRVDRLRLLGNGVVPDTAEVAFRTLYRNLTTTPNKEKTNG